MADADDRMQYLSILETEKNKDGIPKRATKKPQQKRGRCVRLQCEPQWNLSREPQQQTKGAALIGLDVAKEDELGEWY